jgi:signal transduction histidine kinase
MDVSRILAGKVMIDPSMTDLSACITSVVGTFRPAAALQGVEVSAVLPPDEVKVWGDETRLQQIGWNLLSNAIKFTPRDGSVQVSLATSGDSAVVRVKDTGRGIAPELIPHVFDRYRQAEDEGAPKHNGLGLGLAIVKHLVESHGGTIEAFSNGLGKGAEFVVTLPLRAETVDES